MKEKIIYSSKKIKNIKNNKKGISLIALVIVVIIMLILTASVVLTLTSNSSIEDASEAVIRNDIQAMKDKYKVVYEDILFKKFGDETKIKDSDFEDVVPEEYKDEFQAGKDGLEYIGQNEKVKEIAVDMGLTKEEITNVIEYITVVAKQKSIDIEVVLIEEQTADDIIYYIREKGQNDWTEASSIENILTFENLKEETAYEVKVIVKQGDKEYESQLKEVVTKEVKIGELILKANNASGEEVKLDNWTNQDVYIEVATENTTYSVSGENYVEETSESTVLTNEGISIVTVKTTSAGNVLTKDYLVKIDKTKPDITELVASKKELTSKDVILTAKAIDSASGIVGYMFSTDDNLTAGSEGWKILDSINTEITRTYTVSQNGTYYLYIKDEAGNVGNDEIVIDNIDNITPTLDSISVTAPETGAYGEGQEVEIVATYSENIVGTAPVLKIKFGEGEEKEITNVIIENNVIKYTYVIESGDDGELEITDYTGEVKDIAGNSLVVEYKETTGNKITADTTKPILNSISVTSPAAGEYAAGQVVTMVATYSENIIGTVPVLKIKFGESKERTITNGTISENTITYTYEIVGDDYGELISTSYEGKVNDLVGNELTVNNISLTGNKITAYTESVLQSWSSDSTTDFHAEEYRTKISKVRFVSSINVPENVTFWDVSDTGSGSVIAYVEDDSNGGYILTIAGNGKIYANVDSSYLFGNFTALKEIENIEMFDISRVTNMTEMFYNCSNLISLDVSKWDTSKVEDMGNTFFGCSGLTSLDVSKWNTSNVTTMMQTFYKCSNLTELDVSNFNTSNVKSMLGMFGGCSKLTSLDVSSWNTSNLNYLHWMFSECNNLTSLDVSNWNTSNVQNMNAIFYKCNSLTYLDVSGWDTSNVTGMQEMFFRCEKLTDLDVSKWDTSNVNTMKGMFQMCTSLANLDVSKFNTSNVTNMNSMFSGCQSLKEIDVSGFNTGKVSDFGKLFNYCYGLKTLNLSNFDTSKATIMSEMFKNTALEEITLGDKFSFLGNGNITDTTQYFSTPDSKFIPKADGNWYNKTTGESYISENIPNNTAATYTAIPVEFEVTYNLDGGVNPNGTLTKYKYSTPDITLPTPTKEGYIFEGWYETSDFSGSVVTTIPSGSYGNKVYFAKWREMSTTLTIGVNFRNTIPQTATAILFTDEAAPNGVPLTDVSEAGDTGVVAWLDGTTYKVSTQRSGRQVIANAECKKLFGYSESDAEYATKPNIVSIDMTNLNINNVTDMSYMFSYQELTNLVFPQNFNTSKVTTMHGIFRNVKLTSLDYIVTSDGFITDNVTLMDYMFYGCSNLISLDLSKFNTSKVTDMRYMFRGCEKLEEIDVSKFDTSKVTNMHEIFYECSEITSLDVSKWDTSNVTDTFRMFGDCLKLKDLDVSNFDTGNVTNMANMFYKCNSLTSLDVSKWDTSNVTDMHRVFRYMYDLTEIKGLNNFDTSNVTNMYGMFGYNYKLESLDLSSFDTSKVTNMGYMFSENYSLQEVKLGEKFSFLGNGTITDTTQYLPTPNSNYITGADGKWYNSAIGTSYTPKNIPNNTAATYTAIPVDFTITYNLDGGVNPSGTITKYKYSTSDITLPTPTKEGYIFEGWYETADFSGSVITIIPSGSYGNKEYFAKWKEMSTTLTVGLNFRNTIPQTTTAVVFTDEKAPSGVTLTDVSDAGDNGVVAWLDGTTYKVSTQRSGKQIIANADSKKLFGYSESDAEYATKPAITSIDMTNLNINNVTNMSYFFAYHELTNLVFPENFDTSKVTTMYDMFRKTKLSSLAHIINNSGFKTENVTDMRFMFDSCELLTEIDISNFNTSKVTTMENLFSGCINLTNINLSNINTSNVTDMSSMFSSCKKLTKLDLSSFNTSKATDMGSIFNKCEKLVELNIKSFDTSNVVYMNSMFAQCKSLSKLDISNFNTGKVTTMYTMFKNCLALKELNLSTFNTSNVTTMGYMFESCSSLVSLDVSSFDTSNVTHMGNMFNHCESLTNLDVSNFNTIKVEKMHKMFSNCQSLVSLDLSSFDTTNTTNKIQIFKDCFKLEKVTLSDKFNFLGYITGNVNGTPVSDDDYLPTPDSAYIPASTGKWYNVDTKEGYLPENIPSNTAATYTVIQSTTLTNGLNFRNTIPKTATAILFTDEKAPSGVVLTDVSQAGDMGVVAWLDGTTYKVSTQRSGFEVIANEDCQKLFGYSDSDAEYKNKPNIVSIDMTNLNINNVTDMSYFFSYLELTNLVFPENFNTSKVTTMYSMFRNVKLTSLDYIVTAPGFITDNVTNMKYMFQNCSSLTSLDLSNFGTSNVTTMHHMFENCSLLTSLNLNNWDTSKLTEMNGMFVKCSQLTNLDLNHFNVSKVTTLLETFAGCKNLVSLNISSWNTSSLKNCNYAFYNCSSLKSIDLSNFDTSKVNSDMGQLFANCSALTSIVFSKNFNTSNATGMGRMFENCSSLTSLDISGFDTSQVTNMKYMFNGCSNLTSLDVSKWNTSNVTNMEAMFYNCKKLSELNLSNFNTEKVTTMNKMFGGCESLTNIILSSFNTSSVTDMGSMFIKCSNLTNLDLNHFNVSKVTTLVETFAGCKNLVSLNISNWNIESLKNLYFAFYNCNSLKTLDLSNWNTSKLTNISNTFGNCYNLTTEITIYGNAVTSYTDMFLNAATTSPAKITVNYTAETSALVDSMIATKSSNSNVVKATTPTTMPAVFTLKLAEVEQASPEVANITTTVNKDGMGNVIGVYMVSEEETGISSIIIRNSLGETVKEITLHGETTYSSLLDITDSGTYTVNLVTSTGKTKQITFEI